MLSQQQSSRAGISKSGICHGTRPTIKSFRCRGDMSPQEGDPSPHSLRLTLTLYVHVLTSMRSCARHSPLSPKQGQKLCSPRCLTCLNTCTAVIIVKRAIKWCRGHNHWSSLKLEFPITRSAWGEASEARAPSEQSGRPTRFDYTKCLERDHTRITCHPYLIFGICSRSISPPSEIERGCT